MNPRMVLVVDEDRATVALVEHALMPAYRVLSIPEGKRTLELAQTEDLAFAMVGRCLPDIDGLTIVKALTAMRPALPVVFLADAPTKDLILMAFRSGAKDVLEKPLTTEALLESLTRIVDAISPGADAPGEKPTLENQPVFPHVTDHVFMAPWLEQLEALTRYLLVNAQKHAGDVEEWNRLAQVPIMPEPEAAISIDARGERVLPENLSAIVLPASSTCEEHAPTAAMITLSVYCLGKFLVIVNGQEIEQWRNRKGRALFTYLAVNHKKRIYRDVLMETFWPGSDPDSARNSLNVALHSIRRALQTAHPNYEYIMFKSECYFFNPDLELWVDSEDFLYHWKIAQSIEREQGLEAALSAYERTAAAYKGDFLEEDRYENWPSAERENFKEIYLFTLDKLSKYYSLDGKPATALSLCETMLTHDNCREDIHRRVMRCYYRLGQRDKALKQFQKCVDILKSELEVEPTRMTVELYHQIKHDLLSQEEKISDLSEN